MLPHTYQLGSFTEGPFASLLPGGIVTRQYTAKAHILKADAMGPNVPAIRGKAVDANHHRLYSMVSLRKGGKDIYFHSLVARVGINYSAPENAPW